MYKIFVSAMAFDNGKSGISDYIINTVKMLSLDHKLDIMILEKDVELFPIKNNNIKFITISEKLRKPIVNMLWHLLLLRFKINLKKYDLIFLPAGNRRLIWGYFNKTIVTFHDLSQFNIEQKYDKLRMIYIKKFVPFVLKKYKHILSISESTRKDLKKHYGIDENKIFINYNGYDKEKYNNEPTAYTNNELIGHDKKYFLYVARVEHPGKNHMNLIKAYENLSKEIKDEYLLYMAGGLKERSEEVVNYAKNSVDSDKIIFGGFVPFEHLPSLYKNASLFIFPSYYEGFGIPLLESMSSGTPVLCSERPALPEIGGNAVITFDPDDPQNIADKILLLLNDSLIYSSLVRKGLERVDDFSWKKHTDTIINYFEKNIKKGK
ncbi:MAG: glycosyltransferase [Candidatus Delongbacteria bacterium]|nr:glycosyltransferase [Candidatus Delongbacteria bacterium]